MAFLSEIGGPLSFMISNIPFCPIWPAQFVAHQIHGTEFRKQQIPTLL